MTNRVKRPLAQWEAYAGLAPAMGGALLGSSLGGVAGAVVGGGVGIVLELMARKRTPAQEPDTTDSARSTDQRFQTQMVEGIEGLIDKLPPEARKELLSRLRKPAST